jgi:hypothetical protein
VRKTYVPAFTQALAVGLDRWPQPADGHSMGRR